MKSGVVFALTAAHAALFFALGADRYAAHRALVDLGLFTQAISDAFLGFRNTFEGSSHWAFHFSPILFACFPFVMLTHSALALTAIQAVAVALTIPPAYLIARRRTSVGRACAIAGVVALYPPLAGVDFTDFHENGFVPAVSMWLLWALDGKRWAFAYALLAAALAIKEDQALIMLCLGAFAFFAYRKREERAGMRFALVAIAASSIVFIGYFSLLQPFAAASHSWQPTRFYAWRPSDFMTLGVRTMPSRVGYVLLALAPLAFLPLRSPLLLLALPGAAECLLSRESAPYTMGQHYAAVWAPYVLAAFVTVAAELRSTRWIALSAGLCTLTYLLADPLHPGYFLRIPEAKDARLDAYLAGLPPRAHVGTQEEAYTHLGFDPNAQLGLSGNPEYILLDHDYPDSVWLVWMEPMLRREVAAGRYHREDHRGGIELYRKRSS